MIDFLAKYYSENDFDLHFEIPDLGADLYTNKNRIDLEHDFRNIKKIRTDKRTIAKSAIVYG